MSRYITVLIYLPVFYNPNTKGQKKKVEERKFRITADEIARQYDVGGIWHHGKTGIWWDKGERYDDSLRIFEIDIPNNQTFVKSLRQYIKSTLLIRFKQKAIYLKIVRAIISIYTVKLSK